MKGKALIWMCRGCRWISISDQVPHRMDYCKCWNEKGSNEGVAVDHEVGYCRFVGNMHNYLPIALVDLDNATFKTFRRRKKTNGI